METNPYRKPESAEFTEPPEPVRSSGRSCLFAGLGGAAVLAVVVTLLMPATRRVPQAAKRAICSNQLKQLALAMHTYEGQYGALPPAYTVDAEGKPLHSWRALILPYVDQVELYNKIDFSKPWDHPANREAYGTQIPVFQCPAASGLKPQYTTYLAVVAPDSCLRPGTSCKLSDVKDSADDTLLLVEVSAVRSVHWMSPQDADERLILEVLSRPDELSHHRAINAAMVSGVVQGIGDHWKPAALRAIVTIAGSDDPAKAP